MASEADTPDADDGAEGAPAKKKLSGKKMVLFIVLPLLLLCGGGAAAFFLLSGGKEEMQAADAGHGKEGAGHGGEHDTAGGAGDGDIAFYDLPDLLVNLNTGGKRSTYLKLKVSLELENQAAVPEVERVLPRIIDSFQVYLRELRLEDLKGSAGLMRLKEELLVRLNVAASSAHIKDVLFKEMLVQ